MLQTSIWKRWWIWTRLGRLDRSSKFAEMELQLTEDHQQNVHGVQNLTQQTRTQLKQPSPSPMRQTTLLIQAQSDASENDSDSQEYNWGNFEFTECGQVVAVYYMEDYFIGKVLKVLSAEEAEVDFMEKAEEERRYIEKWDQTGSPEIPDRGETSEKSPGLPSGDPKWPVCYGIYGVYKKYKKKPLDWFWSHKLYCQGKTKNHTTLRYVLQPRISPQFCQQAEKWYLTTDYAQ